MSLRFFSSHEKQKNETMHLFILLSNKLNTTLNGGYTDGQIHGKETVNWFKALKVTRSDSPETSLNAQGFPYHYKCFFTVSKPNEQKKTMLRCFGVISGHTASVLCSL